MRLILCLLLLFAPGSAFAAPTIAVDIGISPSAAGRAPSAPALQEGVRRLFSAEYGKFVSLTFAAAKPADTTAHVLLSATAAAVVVSSTLVHAGGSRSLASTVPAHAPASLVATIAGDLAWLYFSVTGFAAFPPSPPPPMTALLQTAALQSLVGWNADELDPISLSANGDEVTVCFPHAYLTLGPLFRITADTVRDIFAQSNGRERVQLSGITAGAGGGLLLLSEREGKILWVDPRLGLRQVVDAAGLPALGGRLVDAATISVLSDTQGSAGISLSTMRGERRTVPIAASYVSAFSTDSEGNFWAWDAGERRIRIVTRAGQEVFSIRPLFPASVMPLPQQLEVFNDGSFLLGGSGEVWRFENTGIPDWRLSRLPGRPGEQLPSSFVLAANRADGSFVLLDAPSRRLVAFSPSSTGPAAALAALYARLDPRKIEDVQEAAAISESYGLSLLALQYGMEISRRGGAGSALAAARVDMLRDKARLYVDLADSLARDLLLERADTAWLKAGESTRTLTAESPEDPDGAQLLQTIVSRRQEVRTALGRPADVRIVSVEAAVIHPAACGATLQVRVRLRASGPAVASGLRVHVSMPALSSSPSLAAVDAPLPGEQRDLSLVLALDPWSRELALSGRLPSSIQAWMLMTWERGNEGISTASTWTTRLTDVGTAGSPAESLACRADDSDPLLAMLPNMLLASSPANPRNRLGILADLLETLGTARSALEWPAAGAPGWTGLRSVLRGLAAGELDWSILTASLAASLGLTSGLVSWPDATLALVDTGIALNDAMGSLPELQPHADALSALSRDGRLCIPLSGKPTSLGTANQALVGALELCAERGVGSASVAWLASGGPGATSSPVPVPFPFFLPAVPVQAAGGMLDGLLRLSRRLDPAALL